MQDIQQTVHIEVNLCNLIFSSPNGAVSLLSSPSLVRPSSLGLLLGAGLLLLAAGVAAGSGRSGGGGCGRGVGLLLFLGGDAGGAHLGEVAVDHVEELSDGGVLDGACLAGLQLIDL